MLIWMGLRWSGVDWTGLDALMHYPAPTTPALPPLSTPIKQPTTLQSTKPLSPPPFPSPPLPPLHSPISPSLTSTNPPPPFLLSQQPKPNQTKPTDPSLPLTPQQNHSVVQSTYESPCSPRTRANANAFFYSGYIPSASGEAAISFLLTVNDTDPIYFYSSQAQECQAGMVGIIRP